MARKLPWSDASAPAPKRIRPTPMQQDRFAVLPSPSRDSSSKPSTSRPKSPPSTPRRRTTTSRTPSTSPPPGPPSVEPMYAGYDRDDIYMMVEDEFQAVAQTFTAHLHHAEYKRLVRKAKEKPQRALPEPVSPMAGESRNGLERERLVGRQREGVGRVTGAGALDGAEEDADEAKMDDPWSGTRLAALVASGRQPKTSLVGLERMNSGTRAARGFSRAEEDVEAEEMKGIFERYAKTKTRTGIGGPTDRDQAGEGDTFRHVKGARTGAGADEREHGERLQEPASARREPTLKHSRTKDEQITPTKPLDHFRATPLQDADPASARLPGGIELSSKSRMLMKRKQAKKEGGEAINRLDEVPLFIM